MNSPKIMNGTVFKTYAVALDKSRYDIVIGRNIIDSIGDFLVKKTQDDRVLIVIDDYFKATVLDTLLPSLSSAGFTVHMHNFEAGKQHKNINEAMKIYETLESNDFARDSTLIAVGGGDNVRLIFRIHPGFHLSNDEIAALLPESGRYMIQREGPFSEILAATDLLISYSSTVIDEALLNGIPVLLFDAWNRYNHFRLPAYEDQATSAVFPVCYVNARDKLREALEQMTKIISLTPEKIIAGSNYRYAKDYRENFFEFIDKELTRDRYDRKSPENHSMST